MQLIGPVTRNLVPPADGYPHLPGFQLAAWRVRGLGVTGITGRPNAMFPAWSYRSHVTIQFTGVPADGDFFSLQLDSRQTAVFFEYDNNATVTGGRVAIDLAGLVTSQDVAVETALTIAQQCILAGGTNQLVAQAVVNPAATDTVLVFNALYGDKIVVPSSAGANITVGSTTGRVRGYGELLLRNAHRAFVSTGLDSQTLYDNVDGFVWGWLLPVGAGPHRRIRVVGQDLRGVLVGPDGG